MAGRKPKIPHSPYNGLTLDQWQASDPYVKWARTDPMFANALAVLVNGYHGIPTADFNGYRLAVNLLLSLRIAASPVKAPPSPTYSEPPEGLSGLVDEQPED